MSSYVVTQRTKDQAKRLGVVVRPSANPRKKLDVFRDNKKVATVGEAGAGDFPTYLKASKALAEERRRLYRARHEKYRHKEGTPSWYADRLLWS